MRTLAAALFLCCTAAHADTQRTIGLAFSALKGVDDQSVRFGPSLYWLLDARSYLLDIAVTLHDGSGSGDLSSGVGAYVPFGDGETAPYLGGGLRFAFDLPESGAGGTGIQAFAAVGLLTNRTGASKFRFQLEAFYDTFRTGPDYDYASEPVGCTCFVETPHRHDHQYGVALSAGLGF